MSITMGYLYKKSLHLYEIQLLAGEKGLDRNVEWIHMIENMESASFLHGGELVFFTGLLYDGEDWILDYVRRLKQCKAAGLVINTGPYIKVIPQSVIDFCNTHDLPLFSLPWDVHLVDITRYLCRFIIDDEKKKQSILDYLKQILMMPEQCQAACLALESQGFSVEGSFRAVIVRKKNAYNDFDEILALLKLWKRNILAFSHHEDIVVVLNSESIDKIKETAESMYAYFSSKNMPVYISAGSVVNQAANLSLSYEQAVSINVLAKKYDPPIVYYDYMGLYKLLLNGTPVQVLKKFYKEILGPLESYDVTHNSNLMETLRYYIEHDCSIKDTAMHEVVHRNTILYKFNKIEHILGKSIYCSEHKVAIAMAFKIKDIF